MRTKEEPDATHRYEAVAVIHKDLNIDNVQGLKGLKSCHTGVGRNVGYKIPITKLTAMGVLTDINNPEYSARENELRALSTLFSKGCLVGRWSPDPEINQRLSKRQQSTELASIMSYRRTVSKLCPIDELSVLLAAK